MVQLYVSQLRKLLSNGDGSEIVTRGRSYELRIDPDRVDAARFERLVVEAAAARGDNGSGETAHAALALWRGPPLADLDEPVHPTPRFGGSTRPSSGRRRVSRSIQAEFLENGEQTACIPRPGCAAD